ncbi:putative immunity protein [Paenibacillus amylolyticus]|uniref:putative immunity protein n=1 Tax=Paenibacillus amylolyticus TaxID=1451 RepID=UPI003EBD93C6
MKQEQYSWNIHEQNIKKEQENFKPSAPKIKITDNLDLRNTMEQALEQIPHSLLAKWALEVASPCLVHLDDHLTDDPRINLGIQTLQQRIDGKIRAFDLRKVGFVVNELAKESTTDISRWAARSFAQAIATGHMRGHALVSSDYAVKVINALTDNSIESATDERQRHLNIIRDWSNRL